MNRNWEQLDSVEFWGIVLHTYHDIVAILGLVLMG